MKLCRRLLFCPNFKIFRHNFVLYFRDSLWIILIFHMIKKKITEKCQIIWTCCSVKFLSQIIYCVIYCCRWMSSGSKYYWLIQPKKFYYNPTVILILNADFNEIVQQLKTLLGRVRSCSHKFHSHHYQMSKLLKRIQCAIYILLIRKKNTQNETIFKIQIDETTSLWSFSTMLFPRLICILILTCHFR